VGCLLVVFVIKSFIYFRISFSNEGIFALLMLVLRERKLGTRCTACVSSINNIYIYCYSDWSW